MESPSPYMDKTLNRTLRDYAQNTQQKDMMPNLKKIIKDLSKDNEDMIYKRVENDL